MDALKTVRRLWQRADASNPAFWVLLACVLYVASVAAMFARIYHFNVVDDAYISFQYARNWVSGRGVVFNPGEHVEGYTNFLWVALLAPFYAMARALSIDFTRVAIALSIVLALFDLGLVYAIARRLYKRDWFAVSVALLLCAIDNAYLGYAMSALENHLLIFCSLGAIYAWVLPAKRPWAWTGAALVAAVMTRPDAALLVATFGVSSVFGLVLTDPSRPWESRTTLVKNLGLALAVWVVGYGAYFAWRYHYYGELLPNTFYLKVGSHIDATERGLVYTRSFVEDRYYVPCLALLAIFWPRASAVRWMLLFVTLQAAYVTYVGGDFYSGHRFYVVVLPVLALLVGWVVHRLRARFARLRPGRWLRTHTAAMATIIGVSCGLLAFGLSHVSKRGFQRGPYANEIKMFGDKVHNNIVFTRWLGTFTEPGASIVVGDIGSTGFFTDLRVIDVYGVIDPVVAHMDVKNFGRGKAGHEKHASRDYLLDRHPKYVKWGYVPGDLRPSSYYVYTDFPPGFRQPALWIKEDLGEGYYLQDSMIHCQPAELRTWSKSGNAFSKVPTTRQVPGQGFVFGQSGSYINSFAAGLGDRATGTLLSPPIALRGDLMLLQVGGGRDPERLRVSLIVDGERVFSATGHDHEVLGRRVWNIEKLKGKTGRIEVVDESTDGWGHILVDEIAQWVKQR